MLLADHETFSRCTHPGKLHPSVSALLFCRLIYPIFHYVKENHVTLCRMFWVHIGSVLISSADQGGSGRAHFLAAVALARFRRSTKMTSVVAEQRDRTVMISDSFRLSIAASVALCRSLGERELHAEWPYSHLQIHKLHRTDSTGKCQK